MKRHCGVERLIKENDVGTTGTQITNVDNIDYEESESMEVIEAPNDNEEPEY